MNNTTIQLTIRGLDQTTKDALVQRAAQRGISLNRYALNALQQSAGIAGNDVRYQAMKQFLASHHIDEADKKAFDEAIAWSDQDSISKQRRDETNGNYKQVKDTKA